MYTIFLLGACILFIMISTSKWNLHPFIALLISSFLFGIFAGFPAMEVIELMTSGFGDTIGKIGLIIIFGVVIGTFLENTGAAMRLAEFVLNKTGRKRIHTANALIGYIISIPVFADSGFLILSPLNQALTRKAGLSLSGTVAALALGLTASHTMVPPTPGPIVAAGMLGADLGIVFLLGFSTSLFALFVCILYARWTGRNYPVKVPPPEINKPDTPSAQAPGIIKSVLPLAVPLVLIILRSVAEYPGHPFGEGTAVTVISFLGNPVTALFIGAVFSLMLPPMINRNMLGTNGWIGKALTNAALIILITGAGGTLGMVLQKSELAELLSNMIQGSRMGIWVPFLMAAAIKTAQGSSTVAIITTAAIMAPLLSGIGLDGSLEKGMVVIAIGAGSAVVSHANDSFFWVVTQLNNFTVNQGYRIHTLGTAVLGLSAMLFLTILGFFTG